MQSVTDSLIAMARRLAHASALAALIGEALGLGGAQAQILGDTLAPNSLSTVGDDRIPPTLIASELSGPDSGVYTFRLTFSEVVAPLTADLFRSVNANLSVSGGGAVYDVRVRPYVPGYIRITLPPGSVVDGAGNANAQQFAVDLFDAEEAPSVQLSSDVATLGSHKLITITAEFSEPVTGLSPKDLRLSGGKVLHIFGAGSRYDIVVQPSGTGDLSLTIPADAAQSDLGIGNIASETLRIAKRVVTTEEARLAGFLLRRAEALLTGQSDLIARLRDRDSAALSLSAHASQQEFIFSNSWDGGIWTDFRGHLTNDDGRRSDYLFGAIGADLMQSDLLIFGAMLQFDKIFQSDTDGVMSGHGWLLGPYVAGQIGDYSLYYEARLLHGRSANSLSFDGGNVVSPFKTRRWLGSIGLAGEIQRGALTFTPRLLFSKAIDRHSAFLDDHGHVIAEGRVAFLHGEVGLDVQRIFSLNSGEVRVNGGGALVAADGGPANSFAAQRAVDLRGRAWLGFARHSRRGLTYSADLALDGLGTGRMTPEVGVTWALQF